MAKKKESNSRPVVSKEFETFRKFAKRVVSVPKKEIDERNAEYERAKSKAKKNNLKRAA